VIAWNCDALARLAATINGGLACPAWMSAGIMRVDLLIVDVMTHIVDRQPFAVTQFGNNVIAPLTLGQLGTVVMTLTRLCHDAFFIARPSSASPV